MQYRYFFLKPYTDFVISLCVALLFQSSMHFYVEANQRLAVAACDAITTGDTERLGAVMNEAQQIFDCTAARVRKIVFFSSPSDGL